MIECLSTGEGFLPPSVSGVDLVGIDRCSNVGLTSAASGKDLVGIGRCSNVGLMSAASGVDLVGIDRGQQGAGSLPLLIDTES